MIETLIKNKVILDAYEHEPGGSCMVTALSGTFRYKGINFPPEQIIGLGSGLKFAFGYNPVGKNYRIEFISTQLFYTIVSNTGIFGEEYVFADKNKAMSRLLELLDSGMPVPAMFNPEFCDTLMKRTPKEFVKHIPAHLIVVVGYDKEARKIFFYDSPQFDVTAMDMDRFMEGRCSGFTDPANLHYELYFPEELYPYNVSVKLGIEKVIQFYKYSEKHLAHKSGYEAIKRFAANLKTWRTSFTDNEIIDNASSFIMALTNGYATKGAFRTQYSIFLKDASAAFDGPGFYEASEAYYYLGKLWIQFQKFMMRLVKDPGDAGMWHENSDYFQLLDEICAKEIAAIELLEKNLLENQ
jgi:hypothetical protein